MLTQTCVKGGLVANLKALYMAMWGERAFMKDGA